MPVSGDQTNGTLLSAVCGAFMYESLLVEQWARVSTHEALALVRFRSHSRENSNRGTGFRLNITATAVGIRTALFVGIEPYEQPTRRPRRLGLIVKT